MLNPELRALSDMMDAFRVAQGIAAIAELGVLDHLADGPQDSARLARTVGADVDALSRVLRMLDAVGVVRAETPNHGATQWHLTKIGACLLEGHPSAMKARAICLGRLAWRPWGRLAEIIRTGKTGFELEHREPFFAALERDDELSRRFGETMTSFSTFRAAAVAEAWAPREGETLLDVGGGHGILLGTLLASNPTCRGVLYDRKQVIEEHQRASQIPPEVLPRVDLVAGDLLESIPGGADVYLLSWILHDWDDTDAIALLQRCAAVLKPQGRVVVVEMLLPDAPQPSPATFFDVEMLVQTGGRERTLAQYGELGQEAGLKLTRTIPTQSPFAVIEFTLGR